MSRTLAVRPDAGLEHARAGRPTTVFKIVGLLAAADLLLVAANLALHLGGQDVHVLSLGEERSIPNWYSSAKMLVLAQLLALLAWSARESAPAWRTRLILFAPALLFLLLSVEETAAILGRSERWAARAADGATRTGSTAGGWSSSDLLLPPLGLAALAVLGAGLVRVVPFRSGVLARAASGFALFLLGAVGLDLARPGEGAADGTAEAFWQAAEEGCELLGLTLLIWGLAASWRPRAQARGVDGIGGARARSRPFARPGGGRADSRGL